MSARAVIIAIAVVAAGLVGLRELADATLTTHDAMAPASRLEVVVQARMVDGAEHTLAEEVEGLVRFCRLEVAGSVGPIEEIGSGRFRFVIQPALDDADQRQFRGCIGDIVVDHVQASVQTMSMLARRSTGGDSEHVASNG